MPPDDDPTLVDIQTHGYGSGIVAMLSYRNGRFEVGTQEAGRAVRLMVAFALVAVNSLPFLVDDDDSHAQAA